MTEEDIKTGKKLVGDRLPVADVLCRCRLLRMAALAELLAALQPAHGSRLVGPLKPHMRTAIPHFLQLEEEWIRSNPEWVAELELMMRTR